MSTYWASGTLCEKCLTFYYFIFKPAYKVGIIMLPYLCRKKLIMQSNLRAENLLQAVILIYGSRMEIAT